MWTILIYGILKKWENKIFMRIVLNYIKRKKDTSIFLYYEAIDFGIRTIELVQEKDSIGQSFLFQIKWQTFLCKRGKYNYR